MLDRTIYNFQAAIDRGVCANTAVIDTYGSMTWTELYELTKRFETSFAALAGHRVGVELEPGGSAIAMLAALNALGAHVFLLARQTEHRNSSTRDGDDLGDQLGISAVVRPCRVTLPNRVTPQDVGEVPHPWSVTSLGDYQAEDRELVTILTSGTEGRPKPVTHTWQSLARPVRKTTAGQRWLLTYRLELYAGLQVALQALLNYGTLLMPSAATEPNAVAEMMFDNRAEFGSATPSYWRRLLMFADRDVLQQVPLRQITLGGEIADQQILDSLGAVFPKARVVHIYATTELGRCFSVTDGKAGFPVSFLDMPSERDSTARSCSVEAQLKVENGQLLVRSANRMRGYDRAKAPEDWFPTGDLVEIDGNRVIFVGRDGDMINVGGNKVRPIEVERLVRSIDGVQDVRVYGKESSVAGQLVGCDVVPITGSDHDELIRRINVICRDQMPAFQIPRVINIVREIATTAAGKVIRRKP